jgi:hypothetical protein
MGRLTGTCATQVYECAATESGQLYLAMEFLLRALRPDRPAAVDDWAQDALAINPEERFQTVTAVWNALRAALSA